MKEIDLIAVAALLHDIGKFRQRADLDLDDGNLHTYAPSHKKYYSHLHAAHSAVALEEMGIDNYDLINIAAKHHLDNLNENEKIVQIADRFASSLDRKESIEELKKDDFIKVALETPFSYVYLNKKPKKYYYKLQKLENLNLQKSDEKRVNSSEDYKKLYKEFIKEFKELNIDFSNAKDNDFLKLKSILEKYTSFIPSSTFKTYPDVSLFDHSLATAAIAVAIKRGDGENFSLIQGDFTSIQSFIFSKFGESNQYLAKILRAKSLFVNIATELISLKIIKELNLTVFNIVMNAGGKFMILAHKLNDEDKEKLTKIREWVNSEFKEINYLQTKFVIKSIAFKKDSFKLGEFSKIYKEIAYEFEKEKLRFIPEQNVFENYLKDTKNGLCEICGIVPLESNNKTICKFCKKFKELGEKLPKTKYINFNLDSLLSIKLSNSQNDEFSFGFKEYPIKRVANIVPKFNESDIYNPKYETIDEKSEDIIVGAIKSFYHIGADGLKIDENGKVFGKNYLAVLKADIDNLGEIFIRGFTHSGVNESTFSRVLYLSRMIDYFFTSYLMDFIKDKNIYTVFAGGDDLFLIGHYEDIVKTKEWIIKNLQEYTKNDDFHLSSGLRLSKPNVPIPLMAELTENDLEDAKDIDGKNAVTIFGISLSNKEFLEMLELRDFFEEFHQKLIKLNSGTTFMYRFYNFIEMNEELKDNKNILQNARWKYMLRYLAEKNFEERKSDNKVLKELKKEVKRDLVKIGNMIEEFGEKLKIPLNLFLYSIRR